MLLAILVVQCPDSGTCGD